MTENNQETEASGFEIKIKNISWDAKQEDVEQFLQSIASVESVKLLVNQKTNRSKGYAYATLKDQESLDKVLNHTELEHFGRTVMIVQAKPKGEKSQLQLEQQQQYQQIQTSLYVGNLTQETNQDQLKQFFSTCGEVKGVKIVVSRNDETKVYGFIDFNNHQGLEEALKLDGQTFEGKEIQVSYKRQQSNRRIQRRRNDYPSQNRQRGGGDRRGGDRYEGGQNRSYDNRPQRMQQQDRDYDRNYDRNENRFYRGDGQRNNRYQERNNDRYQGPRNNDRYQGPRNDGPRYDGPRYEGQRNQQQEGQRNQQQEGSSIYVGNLNFVTDEQTLREVFSQFGQIEEIRIVQDRETGRSKGFGFINFSNIQSAKKALESNEEEVDGRQIKVDLQGSRQNQGYQNRQRNNYGGRNDDNNNRGQNRRQRGGQNRNDQY